MRVIGDRPDDSPGDSFARRLGVAPSGPPTLPAAKLGQAEFLELRNRLMLIGQLVLDTDPEALEAFIRQCDRADSIGPILDPTLWLDGHDQLAKMTRHVRAFATYRRALSE